MISILLKKSDIGKCFDLIQPDIFDKVKQLNMWELASVEIECDTEFNMITTGIKTDDDTLVLVNFGKIKVFPNDTILIDF